MQLFFINGRYSHTQIIFHCFVSSINKKTDPSKVAGIQTDTVTLDASVPVPAPCSSPPSIVALTFSLESESLSKGNSGQQLLCVHQRQVFGKLFTKPLGEEHLYTSFASDCPNPPNYPQILHSFTDTSYVGFGALLNYFILTFLLL